MVSPIAAEHVLRQEPWNALQAFLDLHIANPHLAWDLEDLPLFIEQYALLGRTPGLTPGLRLRRRLARLGASPTAQETIARGQGTATVEEICGWVEHGKAHGQKYQLFHPGRADLTQLECEVLDLSQRFVTEMGKPDFVRICQYLSIRETVTRQSALHALRRAQRKVKKYLQEVGVEQSISENGSTA